MNAKPSDPCFDTIADAVDAIRRGEIIVVTDDEKRENEGDLIVAAERITPEVINFMAKHGRGLICVAMDKELVGRFGLSRMERKGSGDAFHTAFLESVDAKGDVTTGISAADRARTVSTLLDENATADDLVRPGHIFPLEAADKGVLRRAGHTEAAVDLARLAKLKPAGVICEILNDDGTMARLPDLCAFAKEHDLRIISVADLVAYRRRTEKLVEHERTVKLPTDFGDFKLSVYHSDLDGQHHLALVRGNPAAQDAPLVRVHSECLTGDVFGSQRCDCGSQLKESMRMIVEEGHGVILYLKQEGRGIGLSHKIHAYELQDEGLDTVEANTKLGFEADLRDYGIAGQMLLDIGLKKMRLITNNPEKVAGLERYGLHVSERLPLVLPHTDHNARYLETKKTKLGHWL